MNRGGQLQARLCFDSITGSGLRVFDLLIMTSIGTGYDLSASTYSPDGRIFQARTSCPDCPFFSI